MTAEHEVTLKPHDGTFWDVTVQCGMSMAEGEPRMANERLRTAISRHGLTVDLVAEHAEVDRKSVERWIAGRTPRSRHRMIVAGLLQEDERYLWPGALNDDRVLWRSLFLAARDRIEVMVYVALFLHEQNPDFCRLLKARASDGCRVRILIGDPACDAVHLRGLEEAYGNGIASRCELSRMHYRPLQRVQGIDVRLHRTTLYNSIYRFDDEMLVNAHIFGAGAYIAPTIHIKSLDGGALFGAYAESFDRVWETSEAAFEDAS